MSTHPPITRTTAAAIRARKGGTPLVALTAYTARLAAVADVDVDILLVGDSVGMVTYGFDTTLPVTLEMMIAHGAAVVRGTSKALVIVDMPFGSYEESPEQALRHAARVMKETGCGAVKLEGGARMAPTIRFLTERGVPVMAHIGLTPQSVHALGGFKAQGRETGEWAALEADAAAVADAGAFAVVLEAVAAPLAARLTALCSAPTIGIGAGAACDGQILVMDDVLGLTARTPKFVKRYADVGQVASEAIAAYAADVRARSFPADDHAYAMRAAPVPPVKVVKA